MASPYLEDAVKDLVRAVTAVVRGEKSVEVKPRSVDIKGGFTISVK